MATKTKTKPRVRKTKTQTINSLTKELNKLRCIRSTLEAGAIAAANAMLAPINSLLEQIEKITLSPPLTLADDKTRLKAKAFLLHIMEKIESGRVVSLQIDHCHIDDDYPGHHHHRVGSPTKYIIIIEE